MNKLHLFTDGSVNTKTKIGYGAFLLTDNLDKQTELLKPLINIKRFENTSSTKLELETFLWALKQIDRKETHITVYSDSQNLISLIDRRKKLEEREFRNSKNQLLKNHQLYKTFFNFADQNIIVFVKVRGHSSSSRKDNVDKIFSLVDRSSRNALRKIK